jgi:flagellar biosynthesis protein FlhB
MLTKLLQDNLKMLLRFFLIIGVYQYVINKYHDKLVQLQHEHIIHQVHETCKCIGESK